jgi:hypothetical protein
VLFYTLGVKYYSTPSCYTEQNSVLFSSRVSILFSISWYCRSTDLYWTRFSSTQYFFKVSFSLWCRIVFYRYRITCIYIYTHTHAHGMWSCSWTSFPDEEPKRHGVVNYPELRKWNRVFSLPHPNPKYFLLHPSHQIFWRMHRALNVGKKDN